MILKEEITLMKAGEVLKLLRISRATLYSYSLLLNENVQ